MGVLAYVRAVLTGDYGRESRDRRRAIARAWVNVGEQEIETSRQRREKLAMEYVLKRRDGA